MKLNQYIDHTSLKPEAPYGAIERLCAEAVQHQFCSVCVAPGHVLRCVELLRGSAVKVCTVVGFPLGSTLSSVKAAEAEQCIALGAAEIDMVINIGALKSGDTERVSSDIRAVAERCRSRRALLKVIIETSLLDDTEKRLACRLSAQNGADYVKTSTGFSGGGATVADIALMREAAGPLVKVKASGGIRDRAAAIAMIEAGAARLGTSASVAIVSADSDVSKISGGTGY